jgi:uncharacterized membrane protein
VNKTFFAVWRANFLTGLAVVLPAVISTIVIVWVFGTVSYVTDTLLFFIPRGITHRDTPAGPGTGTVYWFWSLVAFLVAVALITLVGRATRNYVGRKFIEVVENALLQVPLLNKIYAAIKQVNEAFTSGGKESFKTVVLVEFPREGTYSIGFLTSEQHQEVQARMKEKVVCVFVPTTPNPTSGFLLLVPEDKVTRLEMSVADGIKFIISLGAVAPEYTPRLGPADSPLAGKTIAQPAASLSSR